MLLAGGVIRNECWWEASLNPYITSYSEVWQGVLTKRSKKWRQQSHLAHASLLEAASFSPSFSWVMVEEFKEMNKEAFDIPMRVLAVQIVMCL